MGFGAGLALVTKTTAARAGTQSSMVKGVKDKGVVMMVKEVVLAITPSGLRAFR